MNKRNWIPLQKINSHCEVLSNRRISIEVRNILLKLAPFLQCWKIYSLFRWVHYEAEKDDQQNAQPLRFEWQRRITEAR